MLSFEMFFLSSNYLNDRPKGVLLLRIFFVICVCLCHGMALLYVMFIWVFYYPTWCLGSQVWYLIVTIPDFCLLSYFTLILSQSLLAGVISDGIHGIHIHALDHWH